MAHLIDIVEDPMQLLTLTSMSYSRFSSYEHCAAKYFYTYVLREPSVFGAPAVLGNIIHTALENVLEKDVPVIDMGDKILQEYEEQIPKWDPDALIADDLISIGKIMLEEFIDRHNEQSFPIHAKEKGFSIVVGTTLLSGYIDRVDIVGDTVYVVDYKSGTFEVPQKRIHEDLQLGIYALAMKTLFPDKQIYASLYYLRSGKDKGHLFTDEDLVEVEQRIINTTQTILDDNTFSYTPKKYLCKSLCDHGKSGACPRGAAVLKYG